MDDSGLHDRTTKEAHATGVDTGAAAASPEPADSAAAKAAMALVSQQSGSASARRAAQRSRFGVLTASSGTVLAFSGCVFTGAMLSMWAGEGLVVRNLSPDLAVFVEANHGALVAAHVTTGLLTLVGALAYLWMHVRFRRAYTALPLTDKERSRVVSSWLVAPIVAFIAAGVIGGAVLGWALPQKPDRKSLAEEFDEQAQELADKLSVRDRPLEGVERLDPRPRDPVTELDSWKRPPQGAIPRYVTSEKEREVWMLHTAYVPILIGGLLLILLPAIYMVQRSRDTLRRAGEPAAPSGPTRSRR